MSIQKELTFNDTHPVPFNKLTPNKMVSVYLMASYLYYILNESPMRDDEYDVLCKELLTHHSQINHIHKYLLDLDSLRAGTAFHLKESDYPNMVKGAAKMWLNDIHSRLGLGGKRTKKSIDTSIKTLTVIDNNKESLIRGVNNLKLHNTKVKNIKPFTKSSFLAEVEYTET